MRIRATWPLPAAAILILVGLIYAQGPLSAQIIGLALVLVGLVLIAWALVPRSPKSRAMSPKRQPGHLTREGPAAYENPGGRP